MQQTADVLQTSGARSGAHQLIQQCTSADWTCYTDDGHYSYGVYHTSSAQAHNAFQTEIPRKLYRQELNRAYSF